MTVVAEDLARAGPLAGLSTQDLGRLAAVAERRSYHVDQAILAADSPAQTFHVIVDGRVAVEIASPNQGSILIETIGSGGILGVSWLLPPYRWTFGAKAVAPTETIAIDAEAVRSLCDADPALGYQLYKSFAAVIHDRLASARIRLLDLYAGGAS